MANASESNRLETLKYKCECVEMATSLPPVTKEQALLETYFQCLSRCAYDKAKEFMDKEREVTKTQQLTTWFTLVGCLSNLAMAEKAYTSLLFLGQNLGHKLFGRKDSLKTSYNHLLIEFRKIEEGSKTAPSGECKENLVKLLAHLSGQLSQYTNARLKLMDFYEKVLAMSQNRNTTYEDLLMVISEITQEHQKGFHHPILSPIKYNFSVECDLISHLLEAQLKLMLWQFLPTLLQLHNANNKLASLSSIVSAREVKRIGFGSSSRQPLPAVYQWLSKYKGLLIAKFSFYFFDVLAKHCQAPAADIKTLVSKASIDFYTKVVTFHRKSDASCVCLTLDINGIESLYSKEGYSHPDKRADLPRGLDSYPAAFSYPGERPERHWPSVVSILHDRGDDLKEQDKLVYVADEKLQCTYFMIRVEPRMTFVAIFDSKKSDRDSYITNFLLELSSTLRGTKLFSALRPGTK